jgi:apolipoprotein N-acyltransferase
MYPFALNGCCIIYFYFLACCSLWEWIKASSLPLGFSFSLLGFFHWVMKKLDISGSLD